MVRSRAVILFVLLAGCATPPPVPKEKQPWPGTTSSPGARPAPSATATDAPPPAGPTPRAVAAENPAPPLEELARLAERDPAGFATRFPRPENCERAARALRSVSAEVAWKALSACVARGSFTALAKLVDGTWDKDLAARPDAGLLVGRVIAARGGDIGGDLAHFQARRIPFFTLASAAENPEVYKGRTIFFLGRVADLDKASGKAVLWLDALDLVSRGRQVAAVRRRSTTSSSSKDREKRTRGYDDDDEYDDPVFKYENKIEETGTTVGVQLPSIDPFLIPGKQFLFVGRFIGPKTIAQGEAEPREVQMVALGGYLTLGVAQPE